MKNQAVGVPGYTVCLQTPKLCLCIPLMSSSTRLTYHVGARFLVWVRVSVCERKCVCVCVSACVLVLVFTSRQILMYCTFYSLEGRRVHQSGPLDSCMCSFEREHVCSHTPMTVSIQCNVLQINSYRVPQWNTVCLNFVCVYLWCSVVGWWATTLVHVFLCKCAWVCVRDGVCVYTHTHIITCSGTSAQGCSCDRLQSTRLEHDKWAGIA